ncbi:MAG: hypothetical protein ACF8PN_16600 [Phycisphaerales bacterium]
MLRVRPRQLQLLFRRICPQCGYDGREANQPGFPGGPTGCPACGCDWDERPPRSYAEMEGLAPDPDRMIAELEEEEQTRAHGFERALALGFATLIATVIVGHAGYLVWSALN